MSDESIVAAVLSHDDNLEALRERIGQGPPLTADELSTVANIPADLLTKSDSFVDLGIIGAGRHEALVAILLAHLNATKAVDDKAATLGWLGSPTGSLQYAGNAGYVRHYERGSVYWTPTFGAHEVHGDIRDFYFRIGGSSGYLGFPQTDELSEGDVRYSNFQGGTINWTKARRAFMMPAYSPDTKKDEKGIYLLSHGTGFTAGGRVSIWIVNEGLASKSFGSTYAEADGRFGAVTPYPSHVSFRPGENPNSVARAVDEATGESDDYPLSYSVL